VTFEVAPVAAGRFQQAPQLLEHLGDLRHRIG